MKWVAVLVAVCAAAVAMMMFQSMKEGEEWRQSTKERARRGGRESEEEKERERESEYKVATHLHTDSGGLAVGWARTPLFLLDWAHVHTHRHRIKVWEHYTFFTPSFAGHLTLTDLGTVTLAAIDIFDLRSGAEVLMRMEVLPPSSISFPLDVSSDVSFSKGVCTLSMTKPSHRTRRVTFSLPHDGSCYAPPSSSQPTLSGDILFQEVSPEALAIVVPFEDRSLFFYEYKMPALAIARGHISFPSFRIDFADLANDGRDGRERGYGVLDWGRGAWPARNHWLWGAGGCEGWRERERERERELREDLREKVNERFRKKIFYFFPVK